MKNPSKILSLGILALATPLAMAQSILYQQDFEGATLGSQTAGPGGGYIAQEDVQGTGWQVQGGTDEGAGGSVSFEAGVNSAGVGGSQGFFGIWDMSGAVNWTWNQYTYYGVPAAGGSPALADIQIALDLLISGSDNNTPLTISVLQDDGSIERSYTPTLANDAFTQVAFGLDEMTGGETFDPAGAFWFRVSHGAGGFGFDAGNTVQIDNVMITVVPEPATGLFLATGLIGLALLRRRR